MAAKAPVKTVVAPAKLPKKSAEKEESPGQAKVKRAKNAYMFFITEKRASVKGTVAALCMSEITNVPVPALQAVMVSSRALMSCAAAENPDLSFTDLTKKLGEMWKSLTDDEKAPFEVGTCDFATRRSGYLCILGFSLHTMICCLQELAKNDKDRAAKERKEVPLSTEKRKAKQPTKTKTSRAKTAYQVGNCTSLSQHPHVCD